MSLPVVAIVGRPNVGKSSLFNSIVRRRASIVDPTAGVTRDRVTEICEIGERFFELVDTGGHGIVDCDDLGEDIERQIRHAIDEADVILFVVDVQDGLVPLDRQTADLLRRRADRVFLVANKVDSPTVVPDLGEFHKLGFKDPIPISATHGFGRTELLERISAAVEGISDEVPSTPVMKIAVVGKRNSGKSSFINALAGSDRVIVSEIPGTTRDSIDIRFERDGRTIVAIDTAGVRKKNKIANDVEYYAFTRVTDSIHRADIVLFMIDSTVPVGQVDKRLAAIITAEYKPCIIVVNKWDLAKGRATTEEFGDYLTKVFGQLDYAPVTFTSAITGRNVQSTIDVAFSLFKQANRRVGTGQLNQALETALAENLPQARTGSKTPRLYYATQVSTRPPTIVVFVNGVANVTVNYERFLLNRFREYLPFEEIPIRLVFRDRRTRRSQD